MYRYDITVGKEVTTFASPWEATAAARDMVMRKNAELVASDIYMTLFENEGKAYTFRCAGDDEATLTRVAMDMADGYGNDPSYNGSAAAAGLMELGVGTLDGNTYGLRRMSCYESWNIFEMYNNHTSCMVMRYAPDMPALVVDTQAGGMHSTQETLDCINSGLRVFAAKYPKLGKYPELYAVGDNAEMVCGFVCGKNLKFDSKHSRLLILPELGKFMLD